MTKHLNDHKLNFYYHFVFIYICVYVHLSSQICSQILMCEGMRAYVHACLWRPKVSS